MARSISDIALNYLLVTDQEIIKNVLAGSDDENILIGKVREFLSYWSGQSWQDTEAIEIAGAKVFLSANAIVWAHIRAMVTDEFPSLSESFVQYALAH